MAIFKKEYHDVVVVGGGMVGATLAITLAKAGFSVMVIDSLPLAKAKNEAEPDIRVSAINCTSVELLRGLQVWQNIGDNFCVPYRRLSIWECQSSEVVFDAASLNLPELGFMVENRRLQQALWQRLSCCDKLKLRCPAVLQEMQYDCDGHSWRLMLDDGSEVTNRLLVGADGANSQVRQQAGIAISGWQYRQSCMLLNVEIKVKDDQHNSTWQMLTPTGPRAFLPLYDQWASLVWYDSALRIQQLQQLTLPSLTCEVLTAFPARLGTIKLHNAASFPLTRSHAHYYVKPGLALIGDAAHTIHPLGGQGVNLGLRDARALAEVLISAREYGECWDSLQVLRRYQHQRRGNNLLMQTVMDIFYTTFSNDLPPLKLARNIGLMLAQRAGSMKLWVLKYVLGM
ncbi:2-octaprenyl-3-methyl-6-methoxy-1,4-benzoquinol hydroxylase [Candidatus Palibaumannia cicadellinicola]|uniref:2-octaprenyl-3-methyl-6-methoxy-1,4-benzoquinol hydroxylase n=1 Tax=Candidatus Palibaumannia cicadellinicola TaxID=186490 RepID=A0A2N4XXJ8_9GAMM|nr:3-demethoxyubiquinol 3-hydroxylase [Candidatus Baumannia cicadellinicola]PLK59279.1 2-octaprenyl-3-methyl-6-methoxy-1,4-benzoquinol hydroxylase [Candidatus Baumannia cicadellinicola]